MCAAEYLDYKASISDGGGNCVCAGGTSCESEDGDIVAFDCNYGDDGGAHFQLDINPDDGPTQWIYVESEDAGQQEFEYTLEVDVEDPT